jgi:hypothetical protein
MRGCLLDVSGSQLCGFYDIKPARFGQSTNFTDVRRHFGKQTEIFNGDRSVGHTRLERASQAAGGVSFGRTSTNRCFVSTLHRRQRNCDVTPPFSAEHQGHRR